MRRLTLLVVALVVVSGAGVYGAWGRAFDVPDPHPADGTYVSPQSEASVPSDTTASSETRPMTDAVDYVNGPLVTDAQTYSSLSSASALIPGSHTAMTNSTFTSVGALKEVEISDPTDFPAGEQSTAIRMQSANGTVAWVLEDPAVGLTFADLQGWLGDCACGATETLGGTLSAVLLDQAGAPTSVTWLDGTGYRWSVLAPPGEVTDATIVNWAQYVAARLGQT